MPATDVRGERYLCNLTPSLVLSLPRSKSGFAMEQRWYVFLPRKATLLRTFAARDTSMLSLSDCGDLLVGKCEDTYLNATTHWPPRVWSTSGTFQAGTIVDVFVCYRSNRMTTFGEGRINPNAAVGGDLLSRLQPDLQQFVLSSVSLEDKMGASMVSRAWRSILRSPSESVKSIQFKNVGRLLYKFDMDLTRVWCNIQG